MAAADVTTHTTRVDGARVAERRTGSGPPVVFVHGLAVSSRYFVPLLHELDDRYTCRAPDLPGFGASDQPSGALSVRTTDAEARTPAAQIGRFLSCGRYADIAQTPVVARDARDAGLRRVAATFRSVLDDAIEAKLPLVSQPVLVVRGSHDPLVPRRWAQHVNRLLPRSSLVEIPGGAHVVHVTRPAQVGAVLGNFLRDPWLATS